MKINVEAFTRDMERLALRFESGNSFLDNFIKSDEAFDVGIGKTFVWIDEKRTKIIGYYNIGVGYIDTMTEAGKYKIGGSIHLNFFALTMEYRGVIVDVKDDGTKIKVSDQLFADFMSKVYMLREYYLGFSFVTLAATDEGYSLYKRNLFEDLEADLHFSLKEDEDNCRPMYLALDYE